MYVQYVINKATVYKLTAILLLMNLQATETHNILVIPLRPTECEAFTYLNRLPYIRFVWMVDFAHPVATESQE